MTESLEGNEKLKLPAVTVCVFPGWVNGSSLSNVYKGKCQNESTADGFYCLMSSAKNLKICAFFFYSPSSYFSVSDPISTIHWSGRQWWTHGHTGDWLHRQLLLSDRSGVLGSGVWSGDSARSLLQSNICAGLDTGQHEGQRMSSTMTLQ